MELKGWASPQMLLRYGASARGRGRAAAMTVLSTYAPRRRSLMSYANSAVTQGSQTPLI